MLYFHRVGRVVAIGRIVGVVAEEVDGLLHLNFFMNVPVLADGTMGIVDGKSKPGDSVDLRAETRVLAVVSNCPQVHNPCNGFNPTPIRVLVTDPAR